MKSLALKIKRAAGGVIDAVADAEAEIRHLAEVEETAKADAERLQRDWLFAENQAAAEQIDRDRIEAERLLARCTALRPELEQRLAAAKAERQREGLARHHAAIAAFAPTLIRAVEAAAELQVEAIVLRDRAVAELSEALVQANIPHLAFNGLLLPDLVQIWAQELRRSFEPPSSKPAPAGRTAAAAKANGHAKPAAPVPAPPRPKRAARADPLPQSGDQSAVVFLKGGIELPNGDQSLIGDRITMATAQARAYALRGIADIVQ
jgi:hypothetical protein